MHSCLFEKWTATSEKHMGHHMTCPSFFGVALSLTILACLLIDDRLCHHTAAPTTLLPSFSFSFLSSLKGGMHLQLCKKDVHWWLSKVCCIDVATQAS